MLPGCLFAGCIGERSPPAPEEIELLIQNLKNPDGRDFYESRERLIDAGSLAVDPLILALEEDDNDFRFEVLDVLAAIGDEGAVDPLVLIVKDKDEDLELRAHALGTLGEIAATTGNERAMDSFTQLMEDEDVELHLKLTALETLGLNVLEVSVGSGDSSVEERVVELLVRSLRAENETVRSVAAIYLTEGGEKAVEPLIQVLNSDESESARTAAAGSLGSIGGDRAFEVLVNALETDESESVRGIAIHSLGSEYNEFNERAVEPLGNALRYDESAKVRKTAAETLANFGNEEAVDFLTETLEDENEALEVREASVFSLQAIYYNFGGEKAIDTLRRNRDCENETLRQTIEDVLSEIETGEIPKPLEEGNEPLEEVEEPLEEF
ncbi:putative lyase [Methanosarcina sp. MTP4]|nr:putative lyase [Methanosarcina sp. MTP4]